MSFMLMEPTNQTFRELIGNGGKLRVPRFQRDYAWTLQQWEDLWQDIETIAEEKYHYMGYIVLQKKTHDDFEIIDGQQRLITLSLVALAAIKNIQNLAEAGQEAAQNAERVKVLTAQFVGAKNPVSLRVDSKLYLNRNNGANFKSICSNLVVPNRRGLTATNALLNDAFKFFLAKSMGGTGEEIAKFVQQVAVGMVFTKIVVHDDLNAYKVFETLNARGVQLSTPDLLKNYVLSTITKDDDVVDEDLDDIDERWSEVVEQLGEGNFTEFVRYHHNLQARSVAKKDLFAAIRRMVTSKEEAYSYLSSLSLYSPIYGGLLNSHDTWWINQEEQYREAIRFIEALTIFNIKQPFGVLMAAFQAFTAREFIILCRYLYVMSIRYNVVCRLSPGEQESAYNQIAIKVFEKKYTRASHVKNGEEFRQIYPSDATFTNVFEFYKMPSRRSSKKIRFLLAEIEAKLGFKTEYGTTQLEHVCPYNPDEEWTDSFGDGVNDVRDRLGNMVLLTLDDLKRKPFSEKKTAYGASPHPLANKVASYAAWDNHSVNDFQGWLAQQAGKTWSVSFE